MSKAEAAIVPAHAPPIRHWRHPVRIALLLAVLLIGTPLCAWVYYTQVVVRNVEDAVAETDGLDPGWRLADIEAARTDLAPEQNSALRVLVVVQRLPKNWGGNPDLQELAD